ncbi:MAG TPA: hypothetical protein VE954_09805 [Oligoflexus sp.]|uniref:DUF7919 family protein n=1 Tax=Oligoflexus sp. TaxID=1971216 RepID=UPI002D644826|nr:hypothetical protein [Oligoflexus sp.]HYX33396.1 hypothetical protein [Oligoflexus sp.]
MHYPDLTDYNTRAKTRVLTVGWLERGHEFPIGDTGDEVFVALMKLAVNPWEAAVAAGLHQCSLCRYTGGPTLVQYKQLSVGIGCANLYIPTDELVYMAPSTIVHYIDAHGYAPPMEFQSAVLACPPMRSMAYLKLISKHGLKRGPESQG